MQRREWACSRLSCKQNTDTRSVSPPFVNTSDVEPLLLSAVREKWRNSWSDSQEILWVHMWKGPLFYSISLNSGLWISHVAKTGTASTYTVFTKLLTHCALCWDNSMQFQDLLLSEVIPVWGAVGSITTLFQTASLVASLILSFSKLRMLPAYVQYVSRIYVWKSCVFNLLKLSWKMYKINKAESACKDFSSWKCVQLCRIRLWKRAVVL